MKVYTVQFWDRLDVSWFEPRVVTMAFPQCIGSNGTLIMWVISDKTCLKCNIRKTSGKESFITKTHVATLNKIYLIRNNTLLESHGIFSFEPSCNQILKPFHAPLQVCPQLSIILINILHTTAYVTLGPPLQVCPQLSIVLINILHTTAYLTLGPPLFSWLNLFSGWSPTSDWRPSRHHHHRTWYRYCSSILASLSWTRRPISLEPSSLWEPHQ